MPISSMKVTVARGAHVSVATLAMFAALTSATYAQTDLKDNTDAKGYVNVKTLTCADLAGTYQEDANFLAVWYSGWLNARAKKHSFNLEKTQGALKAVISYCQANPTKMVEQAVDTVLTSQ
jgi:hypothetical protein